MFHQKYKTLCIFGFEETFLCFNIVGAYFHRPIGLVGRVFTNGWREQGSIPARFILKAQKMVLDTALLNTRDYKVWIKGKLEQLRETLPYILV